MCSEAGPASGRSVTPPRAAPRRPRGDSVEEADEEDDEEWKPDRRPREGPGGSHRPNKKSSKLPIRPKTRPLVPQALAPGQPPFLPGLLTPVGLAPPPPPPAAFLPAPGLLTSLSDGLPPPPAHMIRGLRETLPGLGPRSTEWADYVQLVLQRLERAGSDVAASTSTGSVTANTAGRVRRVLRALSDTLADRDLMLHLLAATLADSVDDLLVEHQDAEALAPEVMTEFVRKSTDVLTRWLSLVGRE